MSVFRSFCSLSLLLLSFALAAQQDHSKIVAQIRIRGVLPESSHSMQISPLDMMQPEKMLQERDTLYSVIQRLHQAETDDRVKAVWFDFSQAAIGLGQMGEIRRRLQAIRAKGKKIWVHADNLSLGGLYLASVADRISITPEGDIHLPGLCVEQLFFKGALDKLKIGTQWIHTGDFKTFGESFYRSSPSEASAKQTSELLKAFYAAIDEGISKSRKLPKGKLREIIDRGIITPAQAVEEKLIDATEFTHEFRAKIRKEFAGHYFEQDYGRKNRDDLQIKGFMDLIQFFSKLSAPKPKTFHRRIKLVVLEGAISHQTCEPIRKALHAAARDPRVRAVVLRVNSPGGSALMSDIIASTVKLIKERRKPFIVSMGDAAASGGYYVSAPADRIFAEDTTMTGSIGVVAGRFTFQNALAEFGITVHTQKIGEHATVNASFTPWSKGDMELMTTKIKHTYLRFKTIVTNGRGDRLKGKIDDLAGGRVYTGAQALKHGLIDEIGGLWEAIEYARKQAKLAADVPVEVYPKQQSLLEILMDPNRETYAPNAKPALFGPLMAASRFLQNRSPRKALQLAQYITSFRLLTQGKPLMMAPVYLY